jgi:hypothetical protein
MSKLVTGDGRIASTLMRESLVDRRVISEHDSRTASA